MQMDAEGAYDRAMKIHPYRSPSLEAIIATNATFSAYYASEVGRFELGEPIIAQDPFESYYYALHGLEDRFELGEPKIATDPEAAYHYARYVLGCRFILGERAIYQDRFWAEKYFEWLHPLNEVHWQKEGF